MHKKLKRKNFKRNGYLLLGLLVAAAILVLGIQTISAQTTNLVGDIGNGASLLVNGQIITPTAAPGSTYATLATGVRSDGNADAAEAVSTDLSPDGKTLLVLTSGYNRNYRDETTGQNIIYPVLDPVTGAETTTTTNKAEWVFVFDVSSGLVKKQQINIPNTYIGLRWAPDGQRFTSPAVRTIAYMYTDSTATSTCQMLPLSYLGITPTRLLLFPPTTVDC